MSTVTDIVAYVIRNVFSRVRKYENCTSDISHINDQKSYKLQQPCLHAEAHT